MNDRYDGYGGYPAEQYELVGYDEYGQPVYRQAPPRQQQPQQDYGPHHGGQDQYGHDPYRGTRAHQDPYGNPPQPNPPPNPQPNPPYGDRYQGSHQGGQYPDNRQAGRYSGGHHPNSPYPDATYPDSGYPGDPYGGGHDTGQQPPVPPGPAPYDPYGPAAGTGQQAAYGGGPPTAEQTAHIPQQYSPVPGDGGEPGYRTEQFAFVEEPDEDSEDVIDWLQFTESRTERREEARRRGRSRLIAMVVVLALCLTGGAGYLWYTGKLPGLGQGGGAGSAEATGPQNRDVIVVHLHNTRGGTSTALLVDNTTTKKGSTVLLPNSLSLTDDDGGDTTLGKSVADDGTSGTRQSLDTLLGTDIQGTWRLDTPFLENLVQLLGNVDVDTDTDVPDPAAKKKGGSALVKKGKEQTLSGRMAVAYATYRARGESPNAQLARFGQVMQAVLRKMPSDAHGATVTVQSLAQILEPPLTEKDLGAFLAKLSDLAKGGDYKTAMLPVQPGGTLSRQATDSVVKDLLGGTLKAPEKGSALRVSVQNAAGTKTAPNDARVELLNGGYSYVKGGSADAPRAASEVRYADAGHKEDAAEVAKTLGLPTRSVRKGEVPSNADVTVVLGQDFHRGGGQ
ncbi:LCP family protein [Streptomyces sp. NPDC058045]|uniref:LCP family protein n=1 Tax=Streptomyces sp. NPDC058045 TaxID=3346311 RepID=UPI0036E8031D